MIEKAIAANSWDSMYGDKIILAQNDDSIVVILIQYTCPDDYLVSELCGLSDHFIELVAYITNINFLFLVG